MITDRKLRVLLIDDQPSAIQGESNGAEELGTRWLEIIRLPRYHEKPDGKTQISLSSWGQHIWLWHIDGFPKYEPDLILIDCRFGYDTESPPLGNSELDPRGLFHGVVYVARMFGRDRYHPFGFSIYTQNPDNFAEDGNALTYIGLLLAMRDSTRDMEHSEMGQLLQIQLVDYCQEFLRSLEGGPARTAWSYALKMYRGRLLEALNSGAYCILNEHYFGVKAVLECDDAVAIEQLNAGLSLGWRQRDSPTPDKVQMSSLFADCLNKQEKWSQETLEVAREWFAHIEHIDFIEDVLFWIEKEIEKKRNDEASKSEDVPLTFQQSHSSAQSGCTALVYLHACVSLVEWLEDRMQFNNEKESKMKKKAATNILYSTGLSDMEAVRFRCVFGGLTWAQTVRTLDACRENNEPWPFPNQPLLKQIVDAYCRKRNWRLPYWNGSSKK